MRTTAVLLCAALLAGCASGPIATEIQGSDPAAFAQARTFAIEAPPPGGVPIPAGVRAAVDAGLADALRAKGYAPADASPNLKVAWRLVPLGRVPQDAPDRPRAEAHVPIGPGDPYAGYRAPGGAADAGAAVGMLLVTITDTRTGAVVWQATGEGAASGRRAAKHEAGRAARAVIAKAPRSGGGEE